MDVDKTGLLRIRDDQKHTAEVEEATAGDGCSPVGEPSTADPLFFLNENGSGFLVQASSAASGYRKPTHVTQESMATTYPGIAYEQQQRRRNCSQSRNTNYEREKPSDRWARIDVHWERSDETCLYDDQ